MTSVSAGHNKGEQERNKRSETDRLREVGERESEREREREREREGGGREPER